MTLIISAVTSSSIVQVSDRRLTLKDGTVYNDEANKAVCIDCVDSRISVAYTGAACIMCKPTDLWIVDYLQEIGAGKLRGLDIVESLTKHLNTASTFLRQYYTSPGLTIALCGIGPPGPFFVTITNCEEADGRIKPAVDDCFQAHWALRREGVIPRKTDLIIYGATSTIVEPITIAVKKVQKRSFKASGNLAARLLVSLVRAAATHSPNGCLIGRSCMSVVFSLSGPFETTYHYEGMTPFSFLPHYIGPNVTMTHGWVRAGEGPAPEWWTTMVKRKKQNDP